MRLSNSKVKTFRRCEKAYEFKYIMKVVPRRKVRNLYLGSWVHDLLQHYYDGQNWLARHRVLESEFNSLFEEEREELGPIPDDALRMMRSYLRTYRNDKKLYRVIDTEVDEMVTLPNGDEFRFIIDLIVEDLQSGGIWLWDHKNVKNFMPRDFLLLDAQLSRYHWCARELGYGTGELPLLGVCFNEIRTKAPTVPKVLTGKGAKQGSLEQRANLDTDLATFAWAMRHLDKRDLTWEEKKRFYRKTIFHIRANEVDRFFRRTFLPKDAPTTKQMMKDLLVSSKEIKAAEKRGWFPRSPDKSCTWCDYLEPCQVQLMGADISDTLKLKYTIKKKEDEVEVNDVPEKVLKEAA